MVLNPGDEISRRIPREGGLGKVRILRDEILRASVEVRKIAPSAAGNEYFLANPLGALDDQNALPPQAGLHRAHQPGRAAAEDDRVISIGSRDHRKILRTP